MPNHIFPRIALPFWQESFTKADGVEENTRLGVGLRFRKIFYQDRQYLRDMISVQLAWIIDGLSGLRTMG